MTKSPPWQVDEMLQFAQKMRSAKESASGLLPAGDEVWYGYRRATETRLFGARTNASDTGKIKWADTTIF